MKLSLLELNKLNIVEDLEKINKSFFQLGHEVEEVINIENDKLIIGKILRINSHPNADKLNICDIEIENNKILQIICGAPNIQVGQKVIVALIGAKIGNNIIEETIIKGEKSSGMICSLEEIGFDKKVLMTKDYQGIHEILEDVEIGTNPMEILDIEDKILDIYLTANRGDCQSYRGLYNDLIALLNYEAKTNKYKKYDISKLKINNIDNKYSKTNNIYDLNTNEKYGNFFSHTFIKNINIEESSFQNKLFLMKHGIKPQNNIVDISNEIMLKTGIPSHIYDADKIKGTLNVELNQEETLFVGIDEKEILIPKGILVIRDFEKIVSIAGVMGSFETKIDENTENILVEVAHFNSEFILKSMKLFANKTEAGMRYSKKIDIKILDDIMEIIISKILNLNFDKKIEISSTLFQKSEENKQEKKKVSLYFKNLSKILGIEIKREDINLILKKLDFQIEVFKDKLLVSPPSYRKDISQENDLIEEIIRMYNINNIPEDEISSNFINFNGVIENNKYQNICDIEDLLLKLNLNEVISYSLIEEKKLKYFLDSEKKPVELLSPLSKEHKFYRQSLITSLLETASYNLKRGQNRMNIFEVGNTYYLNDKKICEELKLSILLGGFIDSTYDGENRPYDFFDLKGILEKISNVYKVDFYLEKTNVKGLNPYASAKIKIGEKDIGIIGEVEYDYFKKNRTKLYVLEINIEEFFNMKKNNQKFKKINNYPEIIRDLTIITPLKTKYSDVIKVYDGVNYLKEMKLVGTYEKSEENKKTYTFKLSFQDESNTLKSDFIEEEIQKIFNNVDNNNFIINR